jgi:hypothetical protein
VVELQLTAELSKSVASLTDVHDARSAEVLKRNRGVTSVELENRSSVNTEFKFTYPKQADDVGHVNAVARLSPFAVHVFPKSFEMRLSFVTLICDLSRSKALATQWAVSMHATDEYSNVDVASLFHASATDQDAPPSVEFKVIVPFVCESATKIHAEVLVTHVSEPRSVAPFVERPCCSAVNVGLVSKAQVEPPLLER